MDFQLRTYAFIDSMNTSFRSRRIDLPGRRPIAGMSELFIEVRLATRSFAAQTSP